MADYEEQYPGQSEEDYWDEFREHIIKQLREAIDWLGADEFVESLLREHWPGETECVPIDPEALVEVLDRWLKATNPTE